MALLRRWQGHFKRDKNMAKDMTTGSPAKHIIGFAIPIFIGSIFQQFYNIVDTMIVGRFVGVNALAAVGSTSSIMFCVQGIAMGMTTGFGVVVSQAFGAKNERDLRHNVAMSAYLTIFISVVVTTILLLANNPLLHAMNTPGEIFEGAYTYLAIIFAGFCVTMAYNLFAAILRAIGDSKTPLYFLMVSSVLNILLDLVFVINFKMGVAGVAYATVISQSVSAILCFFYMKKKYPQVMKTETEERIFSARSAARLMGMGIPMALQFSITSFGTMIVQSALNLLGETAIAAYAAAQKIQGLICQPYVALGTALATYSGQNAGAGNYERIKDGLKKSLLILLAVVMITFAIARIFGGAATMLFVDGAETEVIRLSEKYFSIATWFYLPLASIFIFRNTLQGIGYGVDAMFGGVFELAARALLIKIIGTNFGYAGICFCDPAAWTAALIPLIPLYYYRMRQAEMRRKGSIS